MIEFDQGRGSITTPYHPPQPIPEELRVQFAPATHLLYEWQDYYLSYPGADQLRIGDTVQQPIAPGIFNVRFENEIGLTQLQPLSFGQALCEPLVVEVLTRKFAAPHQHLRMFQGLADDLTAVMIQLPFTIAAPTGRSVREALQPPTPLFVYHFLRHHAAELLGALRAIQAAPHRVLYEDDQQVPLAHATSVDADMLLDILQSPEGWVPAPDTIPLARYLQGAVPTHVWQRQPEETFDTPENRFVRAFVRQLVQAAEMLPRQPWWNKAPPDARGRIRELLGIAQSALHQPPLAQAGEMRHLPAASQVLLRQDGYRAIRELWQLFQWARRPLFGAFAEAIAVRDVATLYELWGFFYLVDRISGYLGAKPELRLQRTEDEGLGWSSAAHFGAAGTLMYNQSFSRTGRYRSFSVLLRPDYVWVRDGRPDVALDAKFRLDRAQIQDTNAPAPQGTSKHADIHKMHTYCDALRVRAAVILYPGSEQLFYARTGERLNNSTVTDILFGSYAGVGAFACQPLNTEGA